MKNAKNWIVIFLIGLCLTVSGEEESKNRTLNTAANVAYLSPLEKEVIYEVNLFRSNPAAYAQKYIAPLVDYYEEKILNYPDDRPVRTKEGVKALRECVRFLNDAMPVPIMYPDESLTMAASDHQVDQAKTGRTGHIGNDKSGMRERIERHGKWLVRIAENISYGSNAARQIVIFLLIDDGVPNRGHRDNLLHPDFKSIGVSCGIHPRYETMCVMDFAGGMEDK